MLEGRGHILITLARCAIAEALGMSLDGHVPIRDEWLSERGACFVTLKKHGQLRGCIGTLQAHRPLLEDVHANAINAALHDPRFPPLSPAEFAEVKIEVSLLSPPKPLPVHDESELMKWLRPGIDGVVLEYGQHKATFLPQVWQQLPDPRQFLAHLKMKAGLAPDFWHPEMRVYTYQVEKYEET